jgi:VIT1/CCC1 family predicted Fe2+/Mn2+ transporter
VNKRVGCASHESQTENLTKKFDDVTAVGGFTATFDDGKLTGLLGALGLREIDAAFSPGGLT